MLSGYNAIIDVLWYYIRRCEMSFISDWLASDGSYEAWQEFKQAAAKENDRERQEKETTDQEKEDTKE